MEIEFIKHLIMFLLGAGLYKLFSELLFHKEQKRIYTKISLSSLDILERTNRNLNFFKKMKEQRLKKEPGSQSDRESALLLEEFAIEAQMEILSSSIYDSFPKKYRKYSLYTNWSQAEKIIKKFRELESSR